MTLKARYPFRCIHYLNAQIPGQKLLIASAGPKLYSYSANDGAQLFVWPLELAICSAENSIVAEKHADFDGLGPPEKKRRLSKEKEGNAGGFESIESTQPRVTWSNIPILIVSPTERYIVVVTAEDKGLRVLEVGNDGSLVQVSERHIPKRPCAVTLTTDGNTILCGDKFGDVYSLPLKASQNPKTMRSSFIPAKSLPPAASMLTVHTKQNLHALEQQLQQSAKPAEERLIPTFEHKLLLGHVSILTDLAFVSLASGSSSSGVREYILSADRDEHIRVTRGPPQTHVIETYCLGHTSFVSKICVPTLQQELLISGGGDDYLLVWDWREGRIVQKVSLPPSDLVGEGLAVRGIWAISLPRDSSDFELGKSLILVALEGSPQLLCYVLDHKGRMESQPSIELSGNVLDVTHWSDNDMIVISIDDFHHPGSSRALKENQTSPRCFLQAFASRIHQDRLEWEAVRNPAIDDINLKRASDVSEDEASMVADWKALGASLYGIENLRKRGSADED